MAGFEGVVYRITFIPGILLGALLAAAAATCIPLGLLLYLQKEVSFRTGRVVNPLRLVVDCADALGNAELLHRTGSWGKRKLRKWADRLIVTYDVVSGKGGLRIRLRVDGDGISKGERFSNNDRDGDPAAESLLEPVYDNDEDNPL
jgi:hypothetical protein